MKSEYINPEQFKFMLDLMVRDNANAVRVSLITGLRIGDVLGLRRADLTEGGELRTICDKTDKPYCGHLPQSFARELLDRSIGSEWLFPSPSPRRVGKPRTRQAVWRDLKRAAKICATPRNVSPHSARKIFAVDQFRKNGLGAAQAALQHDRTETTLIYAFSDMLNSRRDLNAPAARSDRDDLDSKKILGAFVEAFGGETEVCKCLAKFAEKMNERKSPP